MSKEIRVRAWDKKYECYVKVESIDFDFHGNIDSVWIDCEEHHHDHSVLNADEVVLEQYTGLKDKNGKEICIGDIVSEHNGDIVGKITQKPSGEYCVAWIGIYGGSSVLYDELSMCEVIGNIHENPELLEVKNE